MSTVGLLTVSRRSLSNRCVFSITYGVSARVGSGLQGRGESERRFTEVVVSTFAVSFFGLSVLVDEPLIR